jgi:hypothetical protein
MPQTNKGVTSRRDALLSPPPRAPGGGEVPYLLNIYPNPKLLRDRPQTTPVLTHALALTLVGCYLSLFALVRVRGGLVWEE